MPTNGEEVTLFLSESTARRKKRALIDEPPPIISIQGCYGSKGSNLEKINSGKTNNSQDYEKCFFSLFSLSVLGQLSLFDLFLLEQSLKCDKCSVDTIECWTTGTMVWMLQGSLCPKLENYTQVDPNRRMSKMRMRARDPGITKFLSSLGCWPIHAAIMIMDGHVQENLSSRWWPRLLYIHKGKVSNIFSSTHIYHYFIFFWEKYCITCTYTHHIG